MKTEKRDVRKMQMEKRESITVLTSVSLFQFLLFFFLSLSYLLRILFERKVFGEERASQKRGRSVEGEPTRWWTDRRKVTWDLIFSSASYLKAQVRNSPGFVIRFFPSSWNEREREKKKKGRSGSKKRTQIEWTRLLLFQQLPACSLSFFLFLFISSLMECFPLFASLLFLSPSISVPLFLLTWDW